MDDLIIYVSDEDYELILNAENMEKPYNEKLTKLLKEPIMFEY